MYPKTRAAMEEKLHSVPRYLFRGWTAASGGNAKLNTPTKITPPGCLDSPQISLYHMTNAYLEDMVEGHLTRRLIPSRFSSWTPWSSLAESFCQRDEETAYISIIDTKMLMDTNPVFNVPDFAALIPSDEEGHQKWADYLAHYNCEYFVYGIVQGPYLRSVPYKGFKEALLGVPRSLSIVTEQMGDEYGEGCSMKYLAACDPVPLTENLAMKIRLLGMLYGPYFAKPIILQLIARVIIMGKRRPTESEALETERIINDAVQGLHISGDWRDGWRSLPTWSEVWLFYLLWSLTTPAPVGHSEHDFEEDGKIMAKYGTKVEFYWKGERRTAEKVRQRSKPALPPIELALRDFGTDPKTGRNYNERMRIAVDQLGMIHARLAAKLEEMRAYQRTQVYQSCTDPPRIGLHSEAARSADYLQRLQEGLSGLML